MDRHEKEALDHYLTTDPRDSEPEPKYMVAVVWVKLDPIMDEETTTSDVRTSMEMALKHDLRRTFPFDVDEIEVSTGEEYDDAIRGK